MFNKRGTRREQDTSLDNDSLYIDPKMIAPSGHPPRTWTVSEEYGVPIYPVSNYEERS